MASRRARARIWSWRRSGGRGGLDGLIAMAMTKGQKGTSWILMWNCEFAGCELGGEINWMIELRSVERMVRWLRVWLQAWEWEFGFGIGWLEKWCLQVWRLRDGGWWWCRPWW
jgi:hypothetical protein